MDIIFEKIQIGIEKYNRIMKRVHETDVSVDADFQRVFNGFYRMRQRPESFYRIYYEYLERNKDNGDLTFEDVVTYLYHETGSIHASFSSKLLATVRPDMPVWDKFVLQNLGLRAPITMKKKDCRKQSGCMIESVNGTLPPKLLKNCLFLMRSSLTAIFQT